MGQPTGKGNRKAGRSKRKGLDSVLSSFVRGKITANTYFKTKGLSTHQSYVRTIIPAKFK